MEHRSTVLLALLLFYFQAALVVAQPPPDPEVQEEEPFFEEDDVSLEELMQMTVTSVAKQEQALSRTAAAVFVIEDADIRRMGAETIADAIRLVPGFQVAQIDRSRWAITARGLGGEFANKLLVMQDGRTLYSPFFSGTHWDVQDGILEDIARIETVRGPGGTLWGANAVNGVINIMTKHSRDTQGWLVKGGWGTEDRGWAQVRYGGGNEDDLHWRVWGKGLRRQSFLVPETGRESFDEFEALRGGFRVDWEAGSHDRFRFQGEGYLATAGRRTELPTLADPTAFAFLGTDEDLRGGHLLIHWAHTFSEASELRAQVYYDHARRNGLQYDETRDTFDFEFQHSWRPHARHQLTWGGGYRLSTDKVGPTRVLFFRQPQRDEQIFNLFVQYTFEAVPERLWLTAGTKVEHNQFTFFEIQPSFRAAWIPHEDHSVWASVSRAVRTPSRTDRTAVGVAGPLPAFVPLPPGQGQFFGTDNFGSENLLAVEAGWRWAITPRVFVDSSFHYSRYDGVREFTIGAPILPPATAFPVLPYVLTNAQDGSSWGFELALDTEPIEGWRMRLGFAHLDPEIGELNTQILSRNTASFASYLDITEDVEFNLFFYYGEVAPINNLSDADPILRLDVNLVWRPEDWIEVTVGGRNLLDDANQEFASLLVNQASSVERMGYIAVAFTF